MNWLLRKFLTEHQLVKLGDWIIAAFPWVERLAQWLTHWLDKEHSGRMSDCATCKAHGWSR